MENRKKKTMKTDNYLHSVKQNYKDNMVDCFLFSTDDLQGVPKVCSSALQVCNAVRQDHSLLSMIGLHKQIFKQKLCLFNLILYFIFVVPSFDSNTFGILVHEFIFLPHFFFYFVAHIARIRSSFFVNIMKDKPS